MSYNLNLTDCVNTLHVGSSKLSVFNVVLSTESGTVMEGSYHLCVCACACACACVHACVWSINK